MKKLKLTLMGLLGLCGMAMPETASQSQPKKPAEAVAPAAPEVQPEPKEEIIRLTEDDYQEIAKTLGIEVATIKAVVEIEAGRTHEGFSAPGKPIVNFDMSMFQRHARKNGVNLAKYRRSHPHVFVGRSRGNQAQVFKRLEAARSIDNRTAIEGTFWGMFQIGGFNWRKCGCASIEEFVERMSRSERDQLELFANFISSTGLLQHLKTKNWAAFARGYNGASYASRGYHTRLASAYARHRR